MAQRIMLAAFLALLCIPTLILQRALAGWEIPFEGSRSEPVVYDGIIYIGSFDGAIYAIEPRSGKQIWRYQTGVGLTSGPEIIMAPGKRFEDQLGAALGALEKKGKGKREIDATPVIKDGTVYIGSKDHAFYALDAKTGELRWATNIGHPISREALVIDETILVHGRDKSPAIEVIYAVHKDDGRVIWSTAGKGTASYPSVSGKVAYYCLSPEAGYTNFLINAAEVGTGALLWKQELRGIPKQIFVYHDLVYVSFYVGGGPGNTPYLMDIVALRTSSGEPTWRLTAGSYYAPYDMQFLAGEEQLYLVSPKGVYAINNITGKQNWFLDGTFSPYEAIIGEFLYVHGDSSQKDERLYAIDKKTGKIVWNYSDKNLFYTRLAGDTLYVSAEQSLRSLNSSTGKELWKFKTGGLFKAGSNVSASPAIHDNHVIFPTETNMIWGRDSIQGHLYSVDANTGKVK